MCKKVYGQIGRLRKEKIEEYKRLHMTDIHTPEWAGVLATISDCNMRNYSIFIEDDVVFGYFEYIGEDYDSDMKKMSDDPITQEWWKLTRPCFTKYASTSKEAFYSDMQQIFEYNG